MKCPLRLLNQVKLLLAIFVFEEILFHSLEYECFNHCLMAILDQGRSFATQNSLQSRNRFPSNFISQVALTLLGSRIAD